jgi:Arc/MetJ-type ribon-helix-helix transcriptional regulator
MSEQLPLDQFVQRQLASGKYPSKEALVEEALRLLQERVEEEEERLSAQAQPGKHIWEIAEELFGELSDEDLESLPIDGAAQVDHYVYGLPKRPA